MIERTAGMMIIAPSRENTTAITVMIPKFEIMGNDDRSKAENPNAVTRPDTVTEAPIFCTPF